MDIEIINNPVVKTFNLGKACDGVPEITGVTYDLWQLRIMLRFEALDNRVYVTFNRVRGFRVLDEGNLLEFWDPDTRVSGWLWQVQKGSWFDLERSREGFMSGVNRDYKEFLVLGIDDCVSVITSQEPQIDTPSP